MNHGVKMDIHIKDVNTENVDDLISLCIPSDKKGPLLDKGIIVKKKWVCNALEQYGTCAKLAYAGTTPVGMIQYVPNPDERIVEITCIFVPNSQYHTKGIGTALLNAVVEDMKTPQPYFNSNPPLALVTYAFEIPGWFPQHKFYQKRGFTRVNNDPYLLYYPFQKGYTYTKSEQFTPQEEDKGKVLIFYDPSCPFCVQFCEQFKKSIREVTDIPIKLINKAEDSQEVKKRGNVPFCVVNKIPIKSFVTDEEKFQSEVRKALE